MWWREEINDEGVECIGRMYRYVVEVESEKVHGG